NPGKWISELKQVGADIYTFNMEAVPKDKISAVVQNIRSMDLIAGIAINIDTDIDTFNKMPVMPDLFMVMTSNNKIFLPNMLDKVFYIRRNSSSSILIAVNGCLSIDNINQCVQAGANVFII